jgi:hypothetical protein
VATLSDIENIARTYLRDFPKFFQTSFDIVGRTYELGQINVDKDSIWVAVYNSSGGSASALTPADYSIDERNGIIRLGSTYPANTKLLIEGYYYEWVTPTDLTFYSQRALEKHLHTINLTINQLADVVINAIGIAAICECLWALMTEYSRDIDVITSESIHIPASQRFRMVQSLLAQWEREYEKHATSLNIGIDRLEVFNLRRVSRTTNRLIPLYRQKEFGDYTPLERLWPEIDSGVLSPGTKEDRLREDVYVDTNPLSGPGTNSYPGTAAFY